MDEGCVSGLEGWVEEGGGGCLGDRQVVGR